MRPTKTLRNRTHFVTRTFPWEKARAFRHWLLDIRQWVKKDKGPKIEASRKAQAICKAAGQLEKLANDYPEDKTIKAIAEMLREVERRYEFQADLFYARSRHCSIPVSHARDRMTEYQQRIFVSWLEFKMERQSGRTKKLLWPKNDPLRDVTIELQKNGIEDKSYHWIKKTLLRPRLGPGDTTYNWVKGNWNRYLNKEDEPHPATLIETLYDRFLWEVKGRRIPTREERSMFERLAKFAPPKTRERPRQKIWRMPAGKMKVDFLPAQRGGRRAAAEA
ncbi:MAG TPA: hypothetical protein VGV68_07855 [Terriglobia bacterium]|nr:hypothetical protein [Terriglobia bacterium]